MKSILISFDQAQTENVLAVLSRSNARGYTMFEQVQGCGSKSGDPHLGSHAWPTMNSAIITVVPDDMAPVILKRLKQIDDDNPMLGVPLAGAPHFPFSRAAPGARPRHCRRQFPTPANPAVSPRRKGMGTPRKKTPQSARLRSAEKIYFVRRGKYFSPRTFSSRSAVFFLAIRSS